MGQDLPPTGGYEPIQYKVSLSIYLFTPITNGTNGTDGSKRKRKQINTNELAG